MTCTRCHNAPGVPRREHAERVLCDHCAQLKPLVEWREPPDVTEPEPETSMFDGTPMDPAAVEAEPLSTLPGFPFLHAGNAAVIVGPTGGGRSSLVQACAYDAARGGMRVAYLGTEVTEPEFNARAGDLARRRGDPVNDALRGQLARVRYLNLASTIAVAYNDPALWRIEMARYDVVLLDPLSAVAAALNLDFDKSNADFVAFYNRLIQPLATNGTAVVMLDNVGHAVEARSRAKGASAKGDVADLTFHCKLKTNPVGLIITAGKVRTVRAAFRRGTAWVFDRETQRITTESTTMERPAEPAWRPTIYMERVSRAIEAEPGHTRRAIRDTVKGKHEHKGLALELLIAEGYVEPRENGQYLTHYSVHPYREASDNGTGPRGPQVVPERSPGTTVDTGPPVPSLKDRGPGTTPDQASSVVPLARLDVA